MFGYASRLRSAERWLHCLVDLVWRHRLSALEPIYQVVQLGVLVHAADECGPFVFWRDLHRSRDLIPLRFKLRYCGRLLIR